MKEKQLQLVTFEQAKRLKKAGFNWYCEYHFYKENLWKNNPPLSNKELAENSFSAPSVALALKWFRDEKGYIVGVMGMWDGKYGYRIFVKYHTEYDIEYQYSITNYDTCDAAESALLDELLTLLEKEKEQ